MATYYYIIEQIDGQYYNVGRARSEEDAKRMIAENIEYDAANGRDTRDRYSYSTNRYDC